MLITDIFSFSYKVFKGLNFQGRHLTLSKEQILNSFKLKDFGDDNFKFDENAGKLSKWVENTVGEGEIALYEQFLLIPQSFQKTCSADT